MIAELEQIESGFSCKYSLKVNGKTVGEASQKDNVIFGGTIVYNDYDGREYKLVIDQAKQLANAQKPYYERIFIPYDIISYSDEPCGGIVQMTSKASFFKRYDYFVADYLGAKYSLFAVGLGKEGYRFPIYRGDNQVALIEKGCVVYNKLDVYKLYVLYDDDLLITTLLCLYIDALMFSNRGQKAIKSKDITYTKTSIEDLNRRFDPSFVDRTEFADR